MITPLRCITSFAEELLGKVKNKDQIKTASLIKNTSKLLHVYVNELLDKTLIDKKMVVAKRDLISLVTIIKECIELI